MSFINTVRLCLLGMIFLLSRSVIALDPMIEWLPLTQEEAHYDFGPFEAVYGLQPGTCLKKGVSVPKQSSLNGTLTVSLKKTMSQWIYEESGEAQLMNARGRFEPLKWTYKIKEMLDGTKMTFDYRVVRGKKEVQHLKGDAFYDPLLQTLQISWLQPKIETVLMRRPALFPIHFQQKCAQGLKVSGSRPPVFVFTGKEQPFLPSVKMHIGKPKLLGPGQLSWAVVEAWYSERFYGDATLPAYQTSAIWTSKGLPLKKTIIIDGEVIECQYGALPD